MPTPDAALAFVTPSPDQANYAARLAVFLASKQSDGITGRRISALWDDWQNLAEKREELGRSDVYTLRRIVPEDRGMKW